MFDWLDNFGGDEVAVHRDPEEGEITGMISYNRTPDRVWVSYLAVMPTERGVGVGRALINHVRQQAGGRPIKGQATPTSETYYEHLGLDVDAERNVNA